MKTVALAVTTLVLLVLGSVTAQATTQEPVAAPRDVAWVRLVNLSPNAGNIRIEFRAMADLTHDDTTAGEARAFMLEDMTGLEYLQATEFLEIPVGDYLATLLVDEVAYAEQNVRFDGHTWVTLAVMGLIVPEMGAGQSDDSPASGFGRLFTGDDAVSEDELALHLEVITNERAVDFTANDTIIRVVHASPGTASIDLVHVAPAETTGSETAEVLISGLIYRQVSDHRTYSGTDTSGRFEVRLTDSEATLLKLSELPLAAGQIVTIFVAGTPLEEAPVQALVLSDRVPAQP